MAPARKRVSTATKIAAAKRQRTSTNTDSTNAQQANTSLVITETENESIIVDHIIDQDGDVIICLEKQPHALVRILVSSKILSLSSSVFRSILVDQGTEPGQREIRVEGVDLISLLIVLRAAHFNFDSLLLEIEFSTFVDIAIICEKYEMSSVLLHRVEKWCRLHRGSLLDNGFEGWILISWVFRLWNDFKEIFKHVMYTLELQKEAASTVDNPFMFWKAYGTNLSKYPHLPKEFLSHVITEQEEYISFLLCRTKCHFDELQSMRGCHHNDICNAVRVGSLIISLHQINVLPGKRTPSDVTASIQDFEDTVMSYNPFSPEHEGFVYSEGIDRTLKHIERKDLCDLKQKYLVHFYDMFEEEEDEARILSGLSKHFAEDCVK